MTALPTQQIAPEDTPSPPTRAAAGELAVPRGADPETAILGPINGRYDLAERIAKGGMGIVYRAHDRLLNRTVAVKVMRSRFLDRARPAPPVPGRGPDQRPAAAPGHRPGLRSRHPFRRPAVHRHEADRGPHAGPALARTARLRPKTLAHFLKVFETLCQAVAYAHQQGVHPPGPEAGQRHGGGVRRSAGDGLGPGQVPRPGGGDCPDSGRVRGGRAVGLPIQGRTHASSRGPDAADGGGAGRPGRRDARVHDRPGEVFGTLPYMPPEQARGEADRVDRRSDVFALGAILCQILTGQPPYFGAAGIAQRTGPRRQAVRGVRAARPVRGGPAN